MYDKDKPFYFIILGSKLTWWSQDESKAFEKRMSKDVYKADNYDHLISRLIELKITHFYEDRSEYGQRYHSPQLIALAKEIMSKTSIEWL